MARVGTSGRWTGRVVRGALLACLVGTSVHAHIGDLVFCDANGNGVFEPADGDTGLAGVTVVLDCGDPAFNATTVTNGDGRYLFSNVPRTPCRVSVDPASLPSPGFRVSTPLVGSPPPPTAEHSPFPGYTCGPCSVMTRVVADGVFETTVDNPCGCQDPACTQGLDPCFGKFFGYHGDDFGFVCSGAATTTTTTPVTATTTTATVTPGSSTTTTTTTGGNRPGPVEICDNCIDDDGNGLVDFEDPACCAGAQLFIGSLTAGRMRPVGTGSFLKLHSVLGSGSLAGDVNPLEQDVFVQLRPRGGAQIFCAHVPAKKFMKMHGAFKFWDHAHTVASARGIDDIRIKVTRKGLVGFRAYARQAQFTSPTPGDLQIIVGFRNPATAEAGNRCSKTTEAFRGGKQGALRFLRTGG